jgi:hypothetical protein
MARLDKAIDGLKKFVQYEDVGVILEQLKAIRKKTYEGDVAVLRGLLNDLRIRRALCSQAAVDSLLALAQTYPLNQTDPITFEPIALKNRIVSSTGHQYDLNQLIRFHNIRVRREGEGEGDVKQLIDPLTNTPFAPHDADYIFEKAKKRGLVQAEKKPEAVKVDYASQPRFFIMPVPGFAPFPVFAFTPGYK